ncbi:hypothetical protein QBC35DRAFT_384997 [Podospora australis]|uniref:Uncharacterized protein n=1 Tax=Podospora australis TaxID=1536484 RepID=A0AAN6WU39_9PEZI|nr:hypothetical protein QBC35DRAFT_384997 [Podospora australis]
MNPNVTTFTGFRVVLTENQDVRPEGAVLKSSSFTTTSRSLGGVQPVTVIDALVGGDDYIVQCDMTKVVHGTIGKHGPPAMLGVFEFVFLPRGATKRFLGAEIEIKFSEGQVTKVAPEGKWATLKSTTEREVTHSVNPSLEVGVDPVKTAVGYTWELKESSQKEGYASVSGTKLLNKTTAFWGLSENPQAKSGLPSFLRTAVLLQRTKKPKGTVGADTFTATIQIRGVVDKLVDIGGQWQRMKRNISSRAREEETVKFDSAFSRGEAADPDNLQNEDINAYQALVTVKSWEEGGGPAKSAPSSEQPGAQVVIDQLQKTPTLPPPGDNASLEPPRVQPTYKPAAVNDLPPARSLTSSTVSAIAPLPSINGSREQTVADPAPPTTTQLPTTTTATVTSVLPSSTPNHVASSQPIDELAALQSELASVRLEARWVQRMIDLVEKERQIMNNIRILEDVQKHPLYSRESG